MGTAQTCDCESATFANRKPVGGDPSLGRVCCWWAWWWCGEAGELLSDVVAAHPQAAERDRVHLERQLRGRAGAVGSMRDLEPVVTARSTLAARS